MIDVRDILYFASAAGRIILHYDCKGKEEIIEFAGKFGELAERLKGDGFIRIHRCYIVNANRILQAGRNWVLLDATRQIKLPLGRQYSERFRKDLESDQSILFL